MNLDEPNSDRILRALRRIIRRTSAYSRSVTRESGISVPQMLCLKAIADTPDGDIVTVAGVAAAVQLSAPTVSRILDRLVKAGYVARERDSVDRRKVHVSLTREGTRQLQKLPTPLHDVFLERLNSLPVHEQQGLLLALERVVSLMDAERIDAAPLLTPELDVDAEGRPLDQSNADSADAGEVHAAPRVSDRND